MHYWNRLLLSPKWSLCSHTVFLLVCSAKIGIDVVTYFVFTQARACFSAHIIFTSKPLNRLNFFSNQSKDKIWVFMFLLLFSQSMGLLRSRGLLVLVLLFILFELHESCICYYSSLCQGLFKLPNMSTLVYNLWPNALKISLRCGKSVRLI